MNSAENQNNELEENITTKDAKIKNRIEENLTGLSSSNWKGYQVLDKIREKN